MKYDAFDLNFIKPDELRSRLFPRAVSTTRTCII